MAAAKGRRAMRSSRLRDTLLLGDPCVRLFL